jgi:hypothetical protein
LATTQVHGWQHVGSRLVTRRFTVGKHAKNNQPTMYNSRKKRIKRFFFLNFWFFWKEFCFGDFFLDFILASAKKEFFQKMGKSKKQKVQTHR